jgi:2-dehydro-3-deoxyphosphooctonate aldolase (KDO 8-P synthase)
MSFFSKNKNFILEIKQHIQNEIPKSLDNVFQVFDFAEWKLTSFTNSINLNVLKNKENFLLKAKRESSIPFGIIVSSPIEIEIAANYANFLYIPGEICRQSDILESCAKTKIPLFIERGIFLAPNDISRVIEKLGNAEVGIVDCGTSNGYSDSILDPRSLFLMQKTGYPLGIHLSDLLSPEGTSYSHRPHWLSNHSFIEAFIKTGNAFGASFFVIKNYGNGNIPITNIIHKIPRNN